LLLIACFTVGITAEPGTFPVSHRDVYFWDAEAGPIWARVHYPATHDREEAPPDTAQGPYPLTAFLHGYFGSAWMYQHAADHFASQGMVVVNMDTQTGVFLDMPSYAREAAAALRWVESQAGVERSWLHDLADGGPLAAMGHSMGGGTLAQLSALEPRIDLLVGFMPYLSEDEAHYRRMGRFDGSALYLAGTSDQTSTPDIVRAWFDEMSVTRRGLYLNLVDVGHQAVSDIDFDDSPLSDARERSVVLELATRFVQSERFGRTEQLEGVVVTSPQPLAERRSSSVTPFVHARVEASDRLWLTGAGAFDSRVTVYAGRGPGVTPTVHGELGLRDAVLVAERVAPLGVDEGLVVLPAALEGLAWLQVVFDAGGTVVRSEPLDVFGVGDPGPAPVADVVTGEGAPPLGDETAASASPESPAVLHVSGSRGCAHAPGWGYLAWLPVLLRRRTR
jgi:dienelactone hydrolase